MKLGRSVQERQKNGNLLRLYMSAQISSADSDWEISYHLKRFDSNNYNSKQSFMDKGRITLWNWQNMGYPKRGKRTGVKTLIYIW